MTPSPASMWVLWGFPLLAVGLVVVVALGHRVAAARLGVEPRLALRRTVVFLGVAVAGFKRCWARPVPTP